MSTLPGWRFIGIVAVTVVVGLIMLQIWAGAHLVYYQPLLFAVAPALLAIALIRTGVPWFAYAFWLAGALTHFWSLAPGNSLAYMLWELSFLAALIVGIRSPWLFWPLGVALLVYNLQAALALNLFNLQQFLSGSVHYVAGAQALLLTPLALAALFHSERRWSALGWCLLAFASLYLALSSGSRAVYLPLLIILPLVVIRSLLIGISWRKVVASLIGLVVLISALDYVFPNQPIATALGRKASLEAQAGAASEQGGFTNRLRLWDQTLEIVLDRPMGAGAGSYQAIIHSYQKYPMAWSNSPHNYFVETAATGGWLRLGLLLALLVPPLLKAWREPVWPWALAVGAFWMTLAFDVTSYYPGVMMLAFLSLGVLYSKLPENGHSGPVQKYLSAFLQPALAALTFAAATVMALWWFTPCSSPSCPVDRYLGIDYKVLPALRSAEPEQRDAILERVRELYPASSWVVRADQIYANDAEEQLVLAREFATRFPMQHPQNYLDWARYALALDRNEEALRAINAGLDVFPADRYPYGEQRMTRSRYAQWIEEAEDLRAEAASRATQQGPR